MSNSTTLTTFTPQEAEPTLPFLSWAPEVLVAGNGGKWSRNALRFATEAEAKKSADALMWRWTLVTDARATQAFEPVNYRLDATGNLVEVKFPKVSE